MNEGGISSIKESFLMVLHSLYIATLEGLNSPECELEMILPEDDAPLKQRVQQLSLWCEGLMYGVGLGGQKKLSKDLIDYMDHVAQISMLEAPDEATQQDDEDLMEMTEYLRMGAIMLYDELNPMQAQPINS
jgi:uncharacterized protein YgfB (UPF0149 family)